MRAGGLAGGRDRIIASGAQGEPALHVVTQDAYQDICVYIYVHIYIRTRGSMSKIPAKIARRTEGLCADEQRIRRKRSNRPSDL